jgi:hypothetical protein
MSLARGRTKSYQRRALPHPTVVALNFLPNDLSALRAKFPDGISAGTSLHDEPAGKQVASDATQLRFARAQLLAQVRAGERGVMAQRLEHLPGVRVARELNIGRIGQTSQTPSRCCKGAEKIPADLTSVPSVREEVGQGIAQRFGEFLQRRGIGVQQSVDHRHRHRRKVGLPAVAGGVELREPLQRDVAACSDVVGVRRRRRPGRVHWGQILAGDGVRCQA